jgi:hypothetical protein
MSTNLTPEDALIQLDNVAAESKGTRADHVKLQFAVNTLRRALVELSRLQAFERDVKAAKAKAAEVNPPIGLPEKAEAAHTLFSDVVGMEEAVEAVKSEAKSSKGNKTSKKTSRKTAKKKSA